MSHLDEGLLQQVVDGELPTADRAAATIHLSTCRSCQDALAAMRTDTARASALLGMLEHGTPLQTAHAEFTRRRRATPPSARTRPLGAWGGHGARQALLRAAVLLLSVTGVAVAAVPGSPVREWITEVVLPQREAAAPELAPAAEVAAEAAEAEVEERAPTGVFVSPEDGRIRVVLSAPSPDLQVRTRVTTESRAAVYATGDAAGARFRTAPGRVEVIGAGPGELEVSLPASAAAAYVEVNGRVYVAKDGRLLRVFAPHATGTPAEPVFRVGG